MRPPPPPPSYSVLPCCWKANVVPDRRTRLRSSDSLHLERAVRQLLANKVSGNLVGLWLLIPEHLRLGTWDLLCGWTGQSTPRPEPRLALQLLHEAALCTTGVREKRALSQNGFELVNGLPWLATDTAIHHLLAERTIDKTTETTFQGESGAP